MRHLCIGLITLFVVACASTSTRNLEGTATTSSSPPAALQILMVSNRSAELEPCGCSMAPLGGLQREKNLLDKTELKPGTQRFFFSGGTTFVPPPNNFQPNQLEHYRVKAGYLAKALDRLNTTAVAPSVSDLALGIDEVRKIEKGSKFKMVSTNLWDRSSNQLIFAPRLDLPYQGGVVHVLGLSGPSDSTFPVDARFEVRNPKEALKEALAQIPKSDRRVILVLSSLSASERDPLLAAFPEVTLFLGGDRGESTWTANVKGSSTLQGIPTDLARSVLKIDLEIQGSAPRFVEPGLDEEVGKQLTANWSAIGKAKAGLAKKGLGKKAKSKLETQLTSLEKDRKDLASAPSSSDPGNSRYSASMVVLGTDLDEPKNELTTLVDEYKEKVRGLAIQNSDD